VIIPGNRSRIWEGIDDIGNEQYARFPIRNALQSSRRGVSQSGIGPSTGSYQNTTQNPSDAQIQSLTRTLDAKRSTCTRLEPDFLCRVECRCWFLSRAKGVLLKLWWVRDTSLS